MNVGSGSGGGGVAAGTARRVKARDASSAQNKASAAIANRALAVESVVASEPEPLSEADAVKVAEADRRAEVNRKLNRSVLAVVERLRKKEALTSADEAGFVRNGKAEVQVWLTEKSEANLAKLKELGFEVLLDAKSARLIIGRVSIDKLEALAELTFVSYVSPQVSK